MTRIVAGAVSQFRSGSFNARHSVAWRWRKARGQSGEFEAPETSDRSRHLTEVWEREWPGAQPVGYLLRNHTDRWVRFHSLPNSKRYAETDAESHEVLRRQRIILDELLAGLGPGSLVVVAADWSASDLASGDSRRRLPDAWPWRIGLDSSDCEAPPIYFWAQLGIEGSRLDNLLLAAADDRGKYTLAGADMTWLFCPYDGGVDVILQTSAERESLENRHADWLPEGGDL